MVCGGFQRPRGTTYKANSTLVTKFGEELEHLSRDPQTSWSQSAIHVEETYRFLDRTLGKIRVQFGHL